MRLDDDKVSDKQLELDVLNESKASVALPPDPTEQYQK